MAVLFLISEELPGCFPQWLCHSTSPLVVSEGSLFCTTSPTLVVSCHFGNSRPDSWQLTLSLVCVAQMISDVEHLFKCLLAGCLYIFFGEMCIQVLSPVFNQIVHSVVIIGIPYRFWMLISYQVYDLQIFSLIQWILFLLWWFCLWYTKAS